MKRAIVLKERKPEYGPIATALIKTGYDILFLDEPESLYDYDSLIVFFNKPYSIVTRARVGWWMCDLRQTSKLKGSPKPANIIFLCNTFHAKAYSEVYGTKVVYMPQCGLDEPIKEGRKIEWTACFVGNTQMNLYHYNRARILNAIGREFPLKIISGERWSRDSQWIYNRTKFNLAISLPVAGTSSNRLYNILASGGFALVSWFPGIELLFENHKHLVWFQNEDQAIHWMKHYSENEDKRREIAREGQRLYFEKHTAKHRVENMFDILEGRESNFRGYL